MESLSSSLTDCGKKYANLKSQSKYLNI